MKFLTILFLSSFCFISEPIIKLKPISSTSVDVEEPSDVCFCGNRWYMVSDKGLIYETDQNGKIINTSSFKGSDFEAICCKGDKLYVTDERMRQVHILNAQSLILEKTITVPYAGPKNAGYEGICYNEAKKCWMLAIEKEDPMLLELNQDFQITSQYPLKDLSDISSICYFNQMLYVLSDEDHNLLELDPQTYKVKRTMSFKILNPEGVAFNAEGQFVIVSDDMQRLFKFNQLP